MSIDVSAVVSPAATHTPQVSPDSWGTATYFARLTGVGQAVSAYWVETVHRPAHRVGHPKVMHGCPGCAFEAAAKREAA